MFSSLINARSRVILSSILLSLGLSGAAIAQTPDASVAPPKVTKAAKKAKKAAKATVPATPAAATTPTEPTPTAESPSLVKASGGDAQISSQGESLKFNTESAPAATDTRPPLQFKDPGETPLGSKAPDFNEPVAEDVPFKTYIGYPKNQVGVYAEPMNLASTWSYNGQDLNFTNTPIALGLEYRLLVTPMWRMEIDYSHYTMSVNETTIAGLGRVNSSSTSLDQYFIKGHYCFIGKSTFYRQLCPGITVGNDAYPLLNFIDGAHLEMSKVQDVVLGVNLSYQEPISERLMFKVTAGYNYGTGLGNSGTLTSKNNSSYYGDGGVEYNLNDHNIITADAIYAARSAKISGMRGNNSDTWLTKSSQLGLKVGYLYSFF